MLYTQERWRFLFATNVLQLINRLAVFTTDICRYYKGEKELPAVRKALNELRKEGKIETGWVTAGGTECCYKTQYKNNLINKNYEYRNRR